MKPIRFVVQHVPGDRSRYVEAMRVVIPGLEVVECTGDPFETFIRTLVDEPHWHIEDDVVLAPDFLERAQKLGCFGASRVLVIRGFSTGRDSGTMPPSSYLWNQCTFFPEGHGGRIAAFARSWLRRKIHPTGFDLVVRDFLVSRRERYYLESPSLVQHICGPSLLGRRSSRRASETYGETYGVHVEGALP